MLMLPLLDDDGLREVLVVHEDAGDGRYLLCR